MRRAAAAGSRRGAHPVWAVPTTPRSRRAHTDAAPAPSAPAQATAAKSASDKLFEDALREEREEAESSGNAHSRAQQPDHPNWDGEERMQDAVLRMLVDKYRPLRGPAIRGAEEKLRERPPEVAAVNALDEEQASTSSASTNLRAEASPSTAAQEHKPWLVTFKPPSHAVSIKHGSFALASSPMSRRASTSDPDSEQAKLDRAAARREKAAQRLAGARESTLEYRLGLSRGAAAHDVRRAIPVGMKGWASLIEERIERARQEGLFRNVPGRGAPLKRDMAEGSAFIPREEFLMNRIVQRQGAAPPWVEMQRELQAELTAFREGLKTSWTRHILRHLTTTHTPAELAALHHRITHAETTPQSGDDTQTRTGTSFSSSSPSPSQAAPSSASAWAAALRSPNWETRERSYHDAAICEINSRVRAYNALAPYAVRRAPCAREAELARCYRESAEGVVNGLGERVRAAGGAVDAGNWTGGGGGWDEEDGGGGGAATGAGGDDARRMARKGWGFFAVIRGWIARLRV